MKTLFDETYMAGMKLKNRFFRSATNDNAASAQQPNVFLISNPNLGMGEEPRTWQRKIWK